MQLFEYLAIGLAIWLLLGFLVALFIGRFIRVGQWNERDSGDNG
jgi:hypothetical protein